MLLLPLGFMLMLIATVVLYMPKLRYADSATSKRSESAEQRATRARLDYITQMAKPAMLAGFIMFVAGAAARLQGL